MPIFHIEGNIGSGKTTLINNIKHKINNSIFIDEPLNKWIESIDGISIFDLYNSDKKRWALTFQLYVLLTIKMSYEKIENNKYILSERSYVSAHIFAEMLHENNYMTDLEFGVYEKLYKNFVELDDNEIYIYIKSSPETCYDRCVKRNRKSENKYTLDYLQSINEYHEKCFNNNKYKIIYIYQNELDDAYKTNNYNIIIDKILNISQFTFNIKENTQINNVCYPVIHIEGNIGSGKSTLFSEIKKISPEYKFIDEPLDVWNELIGGENLFKLYYNDMKRWAFTFEIFVILSKMISYKNIQKNTITERSYLSSKLFADIMFYDKFLNNNEWKIYKEFYDIMTKTQHQDIYVYIKTSFDICHDRCQKRARDGESGISKEYLEKLEIYHKLYFEENKKYNVIYLTDNELNNSFKTKKYEDIKNKILKN